MIEAASSVPRAMAAVALVAIVGSCAPARPAGTVSPTGPTEKAAPGASQINFALIGDVTNANVWALFDKSGYSYNNYAVRAGYWPRLYGLSVPDQKFEAMAADGMPSAVRQEGAFYTATVPVRSDLTWSDGSPLSAEDVAFTVNTVVAFQLGFDWHDYYNPDWLDHAEAPDAHTVRFLFKRPPDAGIWQYGALQGPLVQDKYWAPKVAAAASSLPGNDLIANVEALKVKIGALQSLVNQLYAASITATGEQARQIQADLKRQQGNLDQANNDLTKAQATYEDALQSARAALYALRDDGEPRLGKWTSGANQTDADAGPAFTNVANPNYPGVPPRFERAAFFTFPTEEAAVAALEKGEVDAILAPAPVTAEGAALHVMTSPTRSVRFLAINAQAPALKEPAIRQALACMLDQRALVDALDGRAAPLASFVPAQAGPWYNADAALPCEGADAGARLAQAVEMLKGAGYTWTQQPKQGIAGEGLAAHDGEPVPSMRLLTPSSDELRSEVAAYIQQQARLLGIPLTAQTVTTDTIDYAVFSSHQYDLALLGWRVSPYPGYLCTWFGTGQPFEYGSNQLSALCQALKTTSDLDSAHEQFDQVQTTLAQDVPMVPLYSEVTPDFYRNVSYPFDAVLDGLSGVYGAPDLAVPESP